MSKGVPTGKQLFSGKQAWLSPKDWTSGKIENNLTGDRDKDMQSGLAKYGLHAAVFAPALLRESGKKGSKLRAQTAEANEAQQRADQFNAAQPMQNDVQFQGQNPYTSGPYNQTAGLLAGQSEMAQPGQMGMPPMGSPMQPQEPIGRPLTNGQYGGINPQGMSNKMMRHYGGLSPNAMNPQMQQWLMQNMNQANAGQMGGLL